VTELSSHSCRAFSDRSYFRPPVGPVATSESGAVSLSFSLVVRLGFFYMLIILCFVLASSFPPPPAEPLIFPLGKREPPLSIHGPSAVVSCVTFDLA